MTTLSRVELNRATLARQLLLERASIPPLKAIERLAGQQAQQPAPPFVGLWSRLAGFEREQLTELVSGREAVRATMMRCTLHLMSTRDYVAFRATMQPALSQAMALVLRRRADGIEIDSLVDVAREFFEAEPRTFSQLRDYLTERYTGADIRALAYVVRTHLPLVMVPTEAHWGYPANAAFAVAAAWLGQPLAPQEQLPELVRRYLASFGPASVADAQSWSGLRHLRAVFAELEPELVKFRDENGRELFDLRDAPRPGAELAVPIRFLPAFDNLLLAHTDRSRIVDEKYQPRIVSANLRVNPTFLIDGFVAGLWGVQKKRRVATLTLEPFAPVPRSARKALVDEAERLARFVEAGAREFGVEIAAHG